ncbi:hypothetical protein KC332_g7435 [Hortaea werneckii]|uniref:Uncharacterized protein n=2 Tax=Hortaea werneckii TaxID=91943 RepID=A0A3M7JD08_HORWE|nr:hypothetical protein KC358_g1820 [Hortaea werneckii]OTA24609.1 hypothetical protein BTJ68_10509 [Hortaea werneckii EXF-2000]KAI6849828.1 hypothetical protein KC350_g2418 [Hortaea werneckii]KAI6935954.1 hypothetical protein KC341_g6564 [Hortaea werneckii]KAI6948994.1 hypothetical protein KC348_g1633 [Hortaea werneckii]
MTSKSYSWALVLREALGERIVKYKGQYMTEQRMKVQKFIDAKIQLMDLLPEIRQVILEHLCEKTTIPPFSEATATLPRLA